MSLSPTLELMKADSPGRCIACDAPLGPGRRVLCGHPECEHTWWEVYVGDRVRRRSIARRALRGLESVPRAWLYGPRWRQRHPELRPW